MPATISVVIPCYNGVRFLPSALVSVHAQTRAPHEVIVVDDCSSDDSPRVAAQLGARVVSTGVNGGTAVARNLGAAQATGDYVAFLDADDHWMPEHLAVLGALLDAHPDVSLACSRAILYGCRTGEFRRALPHEQPTDAWEAALRAVIGLPTCTMVRRADFLALGGFDSASRQAEDYEFLLRAAHRWRVIGTHRLTAYYNVHPEQKSRRGHYETEQQFVARWRYWQRLQRQETPAFLAAMADSMRDEYEQRMRDAWQVGDPEGFAYYLGFAAYVPASGPIRRRWARRGRMLWVRRRWNALPESLRGPVKMALGHLMSFTSGRATRQPERSA